MRILRYAVGYTAVAAALPYLVLKIAWLSGSPVGFTDPELVHDTRLVWLNLATAALDAVALALALAFTHRWGQRTPAPLVVAPMWVGTGLLAPIVLAVPIATLVAAGSGTSADDVTARGPVEPWVYGVVYTGFVVEGLALLTAFLWYVQRRWPDAARLRRTVPRPVREIAVAAAALAVVAGATHLAWALGATAGLPDRVLATRDAASNVVEAAFGVLALAGAAGLLLLGSRVRPWVPLALAWVGSGSMAAWGTWLVINVLAGTVLVDGGAGPLPNLVALGKLVAGLAIGIALASAQAAPETAATR